MFKLIRTRHCTFYVLVVLFAMEDPIYLVHISCIIVYLHKLFVKHVMACNIKFGMFEEIVRIFLMIHTKLPRLHFRNTIDKFIY